MVLLGCSEDELVALTLGVASGNTTKAEWPYSSRRTS
jgi:hypothetical protein